MALVLRSMYTGYNKFLIEYKDPRNGDEFLLRSPWPMLTILFGYLLFVKKLGPQLMANRKPFELKLFIFWYNVSQVAINLYIFYGVGFSSSKLKFSRLIFDCFFGKTIFLQTLRYSYFESDFDYACRNHYKLTPSRHRLVAVEYVYFLSRVFDLMDTIIFVLRKKNKQISFLHVYHHTAVVFCEYLHNKFYPGKFVIIIRAI